jgi:hypothetical protein
VAGLMARAASRIWIRREGRGLAWAVNPLRFANVLVITLTLDLATFSGWIAALLGRREGARIANHMITRRGDQAG